jgi:hypothetical protein
MRTNNIKLNCLLKISEKMNIDIISSEDYLIYPTTLLTTIHRSNETIALIH